ncbi:MAG: hypothetical protein IJ113_03310 [Eggerthellaceae bacterium]|nr:hypothetical protein [Eggerthellaceae bacterium]
MKYEVEAIDAFQRRFTIEMSPEEVDLEFAHTYADFAYKYPFDGYAAGEAPREVINEAFGEEAVAATVGVSLSEAGFAQALIAEDLVKIGDPSYACPTKPAASSPFSFTAEVTCSPQYELTSYDPIKIYLPALGSNAGMSPVLQKMRENEALHALQERLVGEIPEIMVDAQEEIQLQEIYAKANAQNMAFEKYLIQQRIDPDQFNAELTQQAEEAVRRNLALEAWGRHIGIEITDAMIASNFKRSGVPYPALEEAQWRANGRITELRAAIRRAGALRDIMQTLQVETVDISTS